MTTYMQLITIVDEDAMLLSEDLTPEEAFVMAGVGSDEKYGMTVVLDADTGNPVFIGWNRKLYKVGDQLPPYWPDKIKTPVDGVLNLIMGDKDSATYKNGFGDVFDVERDPQGGYRRRVQDE